MGLVRVGKETKLTLDEPMTGGTCLRASELVLEGRWLAAVAFDVSQQMLEQPVTTLAYDEHGAAPLMRIPRDGSRVPTGSVSTCPFLTTTFPCPPHPSRRTSSTATPRSASAAVSRRRIAPPATTASHSRLGIERGEPVKAGRQRDVDPPGSLAKRPADVRVRGGVARDDRRSGGAFAVGAQAGPFSRRPARFRHSLRRGGGARRVRPAEHAADQPGGVLDSCSPVATGSSSPDQPTCREPGFCLSQGTGQFRGVAYDYWELKRDGLELVADEDGVFPVEGHHWTEPFTTRSNHFFPLLQQPGVAVAIDGIGTVPARQSDYVKMKLMLQPASPRACSERGSSTNTIMRLSATPTLASARAAEVAALDLTGIRVLLEDVPDCPQVKSNAVDDFAFVLSQLTDQQQFDLLASVLCRQLPHGLSRSTIAAFEDVGLGVSPPWASRFTTATRTNGATS